MYLPCLPTNSRRNPLRHTDWSIS